MIADLIRLQEKVAKLISQYLKLRDENVQLRQELARLQQDTQSLKKNMVLASAKLEQLLQKLPEEEN